MTSKFQKRQYEAIAAAIRTVAHLHVANLEARYVLSQVIDSLCFAFKLDNALFDVDRFKKACTPEQNIVRIAAE